MALRDQPYLPLYVQDFMTDEKLSQCSAKSNGVYVRLMCIMHKSEEYGCISLKQKHKTTDSQIKNFASLLTKNMPYDFHTVTESLAELLDENVLVIEGDTLIQKRMVKDNKISMERSKAGKTGGIETQKNFAKANAKANIQANSEYENENENTVFENKKESIEIFGTNGHFFIVEKIYIQDKWTKVFEDGLLEFVDFNHSVLNFKQFQTKFMRRHNGKHFKDFDHFYNAYNSFVEKQHN